LFFTSSHIQATVKTVSNFVNIVHGGDNLSVNFKEEFRFECVLAVRSEESNGTYEYSRK